MTSDDPPAETNGSGMPVTGSSPTTTAMLMKAWMQIQPVTPAASRAPDEQQDQRLRDGQAEAQRVEDDVDVAPGRPQ